MRAALVSVSVLTALTAPTAAAAATLNVAKPCHIATVQEGQDSRRQQTSELVTLTGAGFAPTGRVELTFDGELVATVVADAQGAFTHRVPAPFVPAGEQPFEIFATDAAGTEARAISRVSALAVTIAPKQTRPTSRVSFKARGFIAPAPAAAPAPAREALYAHYLYDGRRIKTVRLGRVAAPCGTLTVRRRQIPVASPRLGTWLVQFDLYRTFRPARTPRVRVDIQVFRRLPADQAGLLRRAVVSASGVLTAKRWRPALRLGASTLR